MDLEAVAGALHLLAAVLWVGGMAFAHTVLRPAALPLDPPVRLGLWRRVMGRFLPLAGLSVAVLLASGHLLVALRFGGFATAPLYVHAMTGIGWVMALVYAVLVTGPARRFFAAVDGGAGETAAAALARMRRLVATNLVLGLLLVALAGARFG